jgi:glycosyltransferase involved in cell wall biosynthesis
MRIGVLVLMAGREAGGPETYEVELLRAMARIDQRNEFVVYCTGPEAPRAIGVRSDNVTYRVLKPSVRAFSVAVSLPAALRSDGVDLLHSTFTPPPFAATPEVLTLHCLSSFTHPQFYARTIAWRLNALLRIGMRRARRLVCVSETTARQAHEHFGVPAERLSVAYNGVASHFVPMDERQARSTVAARLGITDPYFLFVGKLEPRKNVERVIEAYARVKRETRTGAKLLLAGHRTSVTPRIDALIDRLGLSDDVLRIGYVPGDVLPQLYGAARLFLFPSLWEGFGIPMIEAMACGTPVVTSSAACLPEIAGGAAAIVDPLSVEDIAEAIARLDGSDDERGRLRARGFVRAGDFTWDRSARATLDAYERLAS